MSLRRAWQLVHEYWFDVLVVGGLAWWLADVAVYVHRGSGPEGPLWFDVLAVLAFTTPFFFRRRHPIDRTGFEERRQFFFDSLSKTETLQEHLVEQLRNSDLATDDKKLGELLIGNTNDTGFLTVTPEDIVRG